MSKICEKIKKDKIHIYIKAGAIFTVSFIIFVCLYLWDNNQAPNINESGQSILERGGYGDGKTTQTLKLHIGEIEKEIGVEVSGQEYDEETLSEVFEECEQKLAGLILGENESLDEVRSDLELISEIPETGVTVTWELDHYDVMDIQGKLNQENLTEEGTLVRLTAVLSYGEERAAYEFYARVFPPELDKNERLLEKVDEQLKEADENTKTEKYMILPEQIEGQEIQWSYSGNTRAFGILILGIGAALMICISDEQRKKEKKKQKLRQMEIDYPHMLNKFYLYISAGMTVRKAWCQIAGDYKRNKARLGEHPVYEEMLYATHQMQSGRAEGECYEEFGVRCNASSYRRFGTMLSQNLRKGSKGLTDLLIREAEEAFEERKNLAKKLGEEAGTKLMIPMFLMLTVVFVIVTVSALFTIQI